MEKLGQLMSTFPAALAYVLLETNLTVDTPALGTPVDYCQLVLPNQQVQRSMRVFWYYCTTLSVAFRHSTHHSAWQPTCSVEPSASTWW